MRYNTTMTCNDLIMRRVCTFAALAGAALLAACGRLAPDAVVRACLNAAVDHRYERALAYCGPAFHEQYSNHLWLAQVHRQMAEKTVFSVDPPEALTSTSAQVRVYIDVQMRGGGRTLHIPVRTDVAWRGTWYIDTVMLLGPDGQPRGNVFDYITDPMWY